VVAAHGWYPDPGGVPGRYRYWNGTSWSTETSDDPADPPPTGGRPLRSDRRDSNRGAGTGLGVATLVLVIVVVSAVLIIKRTDDASSVNARSDPDPPVSTISGWDDSSPLPSAGPTASPNGPDAGINCPDGEPGDLAPHPADGKVHGGRLSMMRVPGYSDPDVEYMLSWMSDTQGTEQQTEPGWQSIFAVGEVARTDGFNTLREAAHASMSCAIQSSWYLNFGGRKHIRDEPIMIDGRPGWILTDEILEDDPDIEVDGDQLSFVAVDDGRSGAWSMWCGMVPLGDHQRIALDQKVLGSLEVRS
jgi:hypothetical protein